MAQVMHVDLAKYIGAQSASLNYSEAAGGNIFIDDLPASPDRCVAIYTTGGTEADSKLPYDAPSVQITVRSDSSPQWALDRCEEIYALLHGKRNLVLAPGSTYLVFALFRQSSPVRIGTDENGRHQYSMNIRAETRNPTAERP